MILVDNRKINIFLSTILFVYMTTSIYNTTNIQSQSKYLVHNNISLPFLFYILSLSIILNYYSNKNKLLFIKNSIIFALLFFLLTNNDEYVISNYLLNDTNINNANNYLVVKGITIYAFIYFTLVSFIIINTF